MISHDTWKKTSVRSSADMSCCCSLASSASVGLSHQAALAERALRHEGVGECVPADPGLRHRRGPVHVGPCAGGETDGVSLLIGGGLAATVSVMVSTNMPTLEFGRVWSSTPRLSMPSAKAQIWPWKLRSVLAAGIVEFLCCRGRDLSYVMQHNVSCPGCHGHLRRDGPKHIRSGDCKFPLDDAACAKQAPHGPVAQSGTRLQRGCSSNYRLDWEGHALDITHVIQGWLHLLNLPAACVSELNQSEQPSDLKPSQRLDYALAKIALHRSRSLLPRTSGTTALMMIQMNIMYHKHLKPKAAGDLGLKTALDSASSRQPKPTATPRPRQHGDEPAGPRRHRQDASTQAKPERRVVSGGGAGGDPDPEPGDDGDHDGGDDEWNRFDLGASLQLLRSSQLGVVRRALRRYTSQDARHLSYLQGLEPARTTIDDSHVIENSIQRGGAD